MKEEIFFRQECKTKSELIEEYRYVNVDHDWSDIIIEYHEARLMELGYHDIQIVWRGFGSQGDGASFTAKRDFNGTTVEIYRTRNHLSCHENTMFVEAEDEMRLGMILSLQRDAREMARDIYRDLESAYDHLTSDEIVWETIVANDYFGWECEHDSKW